MANRGERRWVFFDLGDTLLHLRAEINEYWAAEISRRNGKSIGAEELTRAIQAEWKSPAHSGKNLHPPEGDGEIAFLQSFYRAVLVRLGHLEAATPGADARWDQLVAAMVYMIE